MRRIAATAFLLGLACLPLTLAGVILLGWPWWAWLTNVTLLWATSALAWGMMPRPTLRRNSGQALDERMAANRLAYKLRTGPGLLRRSRTGHRKARLSSLPSSGQREREP